MYKYMYIYIYIYIYFISLSHLMFFDDTNGIEVVDLEESFRKQKLKVICFRLRLTGVEIWPFPFRKGVISYGELANRG